MNTIVVLLAFLVVAGVVAWQWYQSRSTTTTPTLAAISKPGVTITVEQAKAAVALLERFKAQTDLSAKLVSEGIKSITEATS